MSLNNQKSELFYLSNLNKVIIHKIHTIKLIYTMYTFNINIMIFIYLLTMHFFLHELNTIT